MAKLTFSRYEEKYIITDDQKNQLITFLEPYCYYDVFSGLNKAYQIYNIFYDTVNDDVVRHSLSKPKYKEKLRMRSYQYPIADNDIVFLEIKKKIKGKISKRRVSLKYIDAINLIEKKIKPQTDDYLIKQIIEEISYFLEINQVYPKYIISYEREALFTKDNLPIRVTFDKNIFARSVNENDSIRVIEDGYWVMEIKTPINLPIWFTRKLSELEVYNNSFSKIGNAYKIKITGEENYVI